ncbi:MAG: hypothetical protein IT431_10625 [Phycisphaerales bacterium]|nr:hypothetical protein [Phycisphaerales bacterium]
MFRGKHSRSAGRRAAALLVVGLAAACQARVIYVDQSVALPGDGSTWAAAFADLQDAIAVAAPGDEIWVVQGVYTPGPSRRDFFAIKESVAIYGGFLGTETRVWERDIVNRTILSGDIDGDGTPAGNSYSVLAGKNIRGAKVSSCWIEGGNADGSDPAALEYRRGGAIFLENSSAAIEQCRIRNNMALAGGAVFIEPGPDDTEVSFWRCFFNGNLAFGDPMFGDGAGGGIGVENLQYTMPQVTVDRCHFTSNDAAAGGGAINFNGDDADLEGRLVVSNSVFSTNSAASGGGIYAGCCCDVHVLGSSFWNNSAAGSGGGVMLKGRLYNNIFWRNLGFAGSMDRAAQVDGDPLSLVAIHNDIMAYDGAFDGYGNIDADPLFTNPPGHDGFAGTLDDSLAILPRSACVQAGDNAFVFGTLDFPGKRRVSPNRRGAPAIIDMGAYEI